MKRLAFAALPFVLLASHALAGEASGNTALALAALVGAEDAAVSHADKGLLAAYMASKPDAAGPQAPFDVAAAKVSCRAGNVNIADHHCDLTFVKGSASMDGRAAQQLFATLALAGIEAQGAAGKAIAEVEDLTCSVDPKGVKSEDGSGAKCSWK